jgi:hypothetical protein
VLEDNIAEKTNSCELAIDGRLLGEVAEERSISELLRDAMHDFQSKQDCPNEESLAKTWPELREQLAEAAKSWRGSDFSLAAPSRRIKPIDLSTFVFPMPLEKPQQNNPAHPVNLPSWRRVKLAA